MSLPTVTRDSTSTGYTASLAAGLASLLQGGDTIRLEGELGAGKTTFVRSLAAALGVDSGMVSSPTFVMMNEYPLANVPRGIRKLVHIDAYRLNSAEDLEPLGWDRFVENGIARDDCVVIVEWPEKIEGAIASDARTVRVRLEHAGETSRQIQIELPSGFEGRDGTDRFLVAEPVKCPVSGVWVEPTRTTYPFAGEREKMADLNRWFTGQYKIARPANENDFSQAEDLGPAGDMSQSNDD